MRGTIAFLLLVVMSAFGFAQGDARKLQPQDVVRISVFNQPQINADVPIGKDGYVTAPFLGAVKAAGLTPGELELQLAKLYDEKLRLRDPIVSVTVLKFREVFGTVGGFVHRPGTYMVRPGDSLVALLNQGGGPIPDRADLRRATLRRAGSNELIPIDLYAMLIRGDTSQNYEIQDGDELNIPEETRNRILVMGAVQAPGVYPYKEPMTLSDAIALAKGEVRYRSKFSQVVITREKVGQPGQYTRILANFVRFVKNGDQTQNVVLEPGDFVYIPETNTPDFQQISALANVAFIFDRIGGGLFGSGIFGR